MHIFFLQAALFLMVAAINTPLGYFRQMHDRFSFGWFFYTHLSIPVIIYLRTMFGFGPEFIPLTLTGAVTGQILGGWIGKRIRNPKKPRCEAV